MGKGVPTKPTPKELAAIKKALKQPSCMQDIMIDLSYSDSWCRNRLFYLMKKGKVTREHNKTARGYLWIWTG